MPHCPKNDPNLGVKTETVAVGGRDATVNCMSGFYSQICTLYSMCKQKLDMQVPVYPCLGSSRDSLGVYEESSKFFKVENIGYKWLNC